MHTRPRSTRQRATIAVVITVALLLTACGSNEGNTEADASSWRDTNVCQLLKSQEVARFMTKPKVRSESTIDKNNRPTCIWKGGDPLSYTVKLDLWNPPLPQTIIDTADRVITVGDANGYVMSESDLGDCMMNVRTEPAWMHVETSPPLTQNSTQPACEHAAQLVEKALERLGT